MTTSPSSAYREIEGAAGRVYRVGEEPEDLMRRSRSYMIWLPWVAMMAAGVFEYAYGSAAKTLQATYGWDNTRTFTLVGVWGFFQAGVALPAGRLRERGVFPARAAMLTGSVLCLLAFLVIGNTGNIVAVVAGYSVLGGVGVGLVYASCINIVAKWFPERKGWLTGLWLALTLTAGVSFFGINYEVKFAKASHFGLYVGVVSAILLALVSGTGRAWVRWISDRLGRRLTLLVDCVILGGAMFGVGWSGSAHNQTWFFVFAVLAGFGGGAFYPLFAALTPDYFGENYNASIYGNVYSGKLVGAVLAGPVGAAIIDGQGYPATYVLAGSLSLVAGVLIVFLRRPVAAAQAAALQGAAASPPAAS